MTLKRDWKAYPPTYRAREIRAIARLLRAGESGSIVGLAGAGKSNLLGFLSHRPEVMNQQLADAPFRPVLVFVDLNSLPDIDLGTLYRVILRSLYEACTQLAAIEETLPPTIEALYRKVEDKTDPFLSQSALREALFSLKEKQVRLALMFDPFDQFCRATPTPMLNNLRGLRDSFKANLSYLFGLRHEATYLRSPDELGELFEIMDTHICWLGPMDKEDANWIVEQIEAATRQVFAEAQVERLIDLTGGFPALLRAASLWLAEVLPIPEIDAWEARLLTEPSLQNRLNDIWNGLTGEEQATLSVLQTTLAVTRDKDRQDSLRQIEAKYSQVLDRLQAKHLCQRTSVGWQLFSPLFASFIADIATVNIGKIWHDPQTDRFWQGERELPDLTEQDRRLLCYFLDHPHIVCTIDALIGACWAEAEPEGVSNQAVQQAIRHFRKGIEPNPAKPCYLITQHGAGYRFFPEGAPQT